MSVQFLVDGVEHEHIPTFVQVTAVSEFYGGRGLNYESIAGSHRLLLPIARRSGSVAMSNLSGHTVTAAVMFLVLNSSASRLRL